MDRQNMLAKENYKFYDQNRETINSGHIGDYVLIRDCAVVGYFKDEGDAFDVLRGTNAESGSFMVHKCLSEDDDFIEVGTAPVSPAFAMDWK